MENVKSIEKAVAALPPSELAEFRDWFTAFEAAEWDRKIAQDASSGRLDPLTAEALADFGRDGAREL